MIHPSSHESIVSTYRDMIDYYLANVGKQSKYTNYRVKITNKLIINTINRFNKIVPEYSQIILNGELDNDRKKEII